MCSWNCCAMFCAVLSGFGIVFLAVVGILCVEKSPLIEIPDNKKKDGAIASFIAVAIYGGFLIISVAYLVFKPKKARPENPFARPAVQMSQTPALVQAYPRDDSVSGKANTQTTANAEPIGKLSDFEARQDTGATLEQMEAAARASSRKGSRSGAAPPSSQSSSASGKP